MAQGGIQQEGWLEKSSTGHKGGGLRASFGNLRAGWNRRYFVLSDRQFKCAPPEPLCSQYSETPPRLAQVLQERGRRQEGRRAGHLRLPPCQV